MLSLRESAATEAVSYISHRGRLPRYARNDKNIEIAATDDAMANSHFRFFLICYK